MTKEEIYREIEETLGTVPTVIKFVPDEYLEQEWNSWKLMMQDVGRIPAKWRELISLGIHVAAGDEYGVFYCTETAKLHGATDEEIREVAYLAKLELGWKPFLLGNQFDYDQFKEEAKKSFELMKSRGKVPVTGREKASI
ncbi:MAG: carboxymuconolactone decarboxylase family protein [Armatimonadota bacterium]|nr:carboxymuconolactone decarboxylase family protein [Armatimonadota bacterium]